MINARTGIGRQLLLDRCNEMFVLTFKIGALICGRLSFALDEHKHFQGIVSCSCADDVVAGHVIDDFTIHRCEAKRNGRWSNSAFHFRLFFLFAAFAGCFCIGQRQTIERNEKQSTATTTTLIIEFRDTQSRSNAYLHALRSIFNYLFPLLCFRSRPLFFFLLLFFSSLSLLSFVRQFSLGNFCRLSYKINAQIYIFFRPFPNAINPVTSCVRVKWNGTMYTRVNELQLQTRKDERKQNQNEKIERQLLRQ